MNKIYRLTTGLLLVAGLSLSTGPEAQAQLVQFSFTGSLGNEPSFAPDAQPANANVSDITRSAGISPSLAGGAFSSTGWPNSPVPNPTPLDPTKYYTFTITPNTGFQLNLDSLSLSSARSGSGIREFAIRSSLDNFTANLSTFTHPDETNIWIHNLSTVLGPAFDAITTPVEFRLYGYSAEAAGGTWRIDNVRVFGNVNSTTGASPVVSFQGSTMTVSEAVGTATVTVTIANPNPTTASTVDVVVTGGTATSGTDFVYLPQTVTFPAGSSATQSVNITIVDDASVETDETIILQLQNPSTGVTVGNGTMTITITDNDTPPPVTPLVPIATINQEDANGVALSLGQVVRLRGITYGVNQRPTGLQFTLIDNTGGIGVFRTTGNLGYNYAEGDSIEVKGTIGQFNGLTQINVDSVTFFSSNNPLKTPTIVTSLGEHTESDLVRYVNPVYLVDPLQWTGTGSGFSVDVTDGTNTFVMRIHNQTNLYNMPAPTGSFYLSGIGGQFDSSNPFTSGYQLLPRSSADLQFIPTVGFTSTIQSVSEGVGTATITIAMSTASPTPTTLTVSATGGTATAGTDYIFTTQTVTFPANSTAPQTVSVVIIDDPQAEADETIVFTISNVSSGATLGNGTHTLTILNNDPIGLAEDIKENSLSLYPNPATVSATIVLDRLMGVSQVQVFNQLGQLISTATVAEGANAYVLNMDKLATGLYSVRVVNNEVVKTGIIVKQ